MSRVKKPRTMRAVTARANLGFARDGRKPAGAMDGDPCRADAALRACGGLRVGRHEGGRRIRGTPRL